MSKKGFSLVEVLITGALLGGLALVGINLTKQSKVSSTKMQFDTDMTLTTNEINAILSDPTKCLATLGSTSSPTNINGKFFTVSSGSAPANGYGNGGLDISGYKFGGTAPNGLLAISYQNKNLLKGSSGASTFTKTVNMYFEGAVGAVTKCRSLATSSTDIWSRGSGSNINYNGGNVGVGTDSPVVSLDIAGGLRPGSENQVTTCDAATEGTQRYNKGLHQLEFCGYNVGPPVSYTWRTFNGAGTPVFVWGLGSVNNQNFYGAVISCPAGKNIQGYIPRMVPAYPGHGGYGGYSVVYRQGCDILSPSVARCYNIYTPGQWDNWTWSGNYDYGGWLICN